MAKNKTQKVIKKVAKDQHPKKVAAKKADKKDAKVSAKSASPSKMAKVSAKPTPSGSTKKPAAHDDAKKISQKSNANQASAAQSTGGEKTQKKSATPAASDLLKTAPVKAVASKTAKGAGAKGKGKGKKTETKEDDFDADVDIDGFGDSEIAEYEDDLKAVEEFDDVEVADLESDDDVEERDQEVYLTDSEGRRLCRVRDCDQVASVDGYCRYHYLLLWKKIQIRKSILQDGKLEKYIVALTTRYPDKYLEAIRKDLRSEKDFQSAVHELEIDESAIGEVESSQDEEVQSFSDEFRGIGETTPTMDEDGDY